MVNAKIQIATEENLEALLPLVRAYHEFEGFMLTDFERESSVRTLLSDRTFGGIWLVYLETAIVGYIALCLGYSIEFAGKDAFIDEFYIHPDFRGKGLGTTVLDLIKAEAKKLNIRALHLEVARTNTRAKNLYSRANFQARNKYVIMTVKL